jgi:hypothetical protein
MSAVPAGWGNRVTPGGVAVVAAGPVKTAAGRPAVAAKASVIGSECRNGGSVKANAGPRRAGRQASGRRFRAGSARPVDDLQAGDLSYGDGAVTGCRVRGREPQAGFEVPQGHGVQRGGQRIGAGRQPAWAGVGLAPADQREPGVQRRFYPGHVHVRRSGRRPQRGDGCDREGRRQAGRDDYAQPLASQARRLPRPAHPVIDQGQHIPGGEGARVGDRDQVPQMPQLKTLRCRRGGRDRRTGSACACFMALPHSASERGDGRCAGRRS